MIPRLPVIGDPLRRIRLPDDLDAATTRREEADPAEVGLDRRERRGDLGRGGRPLPKRRPPRAAALRAPRGRGRARPRDRARARQRPGRRRGRAEGPGHHRDAVLHLLDVEGGHGDGRPPARRARRARRSTTASPSTSPSTPATARARSRSATCSPTAPASPALPREALDLDLLDDRELLLELLCDAKPAAPPGKLLAYHAVSGGFILGEIVQRVDRQGRSARCSPRRSSTRSASAGATTASRPRTSTEVGLELRHRPAAAAAGLDPRHARARRAARRGHRRLQRPALPHRGRPGGERRHDRERALAVLRDLPPRRRARRRPGDRSRRRSARALDRAVAARDRPLARSSRPASPTG